MAHRKYLDWRGYFEGLYLNWVKAFTTSALALLGTNGAEQLGISGIGMNWKQALSMFGMITAVEVLRYLQTKPKPDTVEETTDTTTITKP